MTTSLPDSQSASPSSWVESARTHADFPLENLPFGIFSATGKPRRPCVAIGDEVLDLLALAALGVLDDSSSAILRQCAVEGALNPLLAAGRPAITALRHAASRVLTADTEESQQVIEHRGALLVNGSSATMGVPARVGDYTDFYASVHHATNVGSMFRPDNALLPNYKWVPIGYHGRASSIVPSGSRVQRPLGQTKDDAASTPSFGPSKRLDYELEVGAFIAGGNEQGRSVSIADAESMIGGLCLVNDWSARDVQAWEYQPLGPFLAKNFATTVSPWMVTLDALEPFRSPAYARPEGDPAPLPYLLHERDRQSGNFDITLEVRIASARMRDEGMRPCRVSMGSFTSMYWTLAQLLTHHASNGCNLVPGDLLASGTVSGETKESRGCLLERTWRGTEPLTLPSGETRRFLEDGDEVILRGWCERDGVRGIGFGECRGIVVENGAQ